MDAKSLLRPWLHEHLELASAKPARELLEQMAPDVAPTSAGYAGYPFQAANGFTLVGRISPEQVAVMATQKFTRNAWRPSLNGRLEEVGFGSRFVGAVGIPSWVIIASGSLLTLIAVFMAMANSAGWGNAVLLGWVLIVVSLVTMVAGAYVGARERDLLLTWLNGALEPAGTATED